jgi:hypothetical protein
MSLFKNESPVLSRQASIAATVPNQSGSGSEPSSFNLVPTEYILSIPLAAGTVTGPVFIADDYYQLVAVNRVFGTASTSGTLQLEKLTGTTAPGSGTSMLTGTVALSGTANTVVAGTLVSSAATLQLAPGDRIGFVIAGTMTSLATANVTLSLKRWQ